MTAPENEISRNDSAGPCPTPLARTISVWLCRQTNDQIKMESRDDERLRNRSVYSPGAS